MSHLESLEAKMASIEVSLSSGSSTQRRRKGTSLGGGSSISTRSSPRPSIGSDSFQKDQRAALKESVIQNLRMQLALGKAPRHINGNGNGNGSVDESEKTTGEQRLFQLKREAENKKIAIRNLKLALEKLDITDNIDVRIRQAELEYALGREELQLLSLVEEIRSLQFHLEKTLKSDTWLTNQNTLYNIIQSGSNITLHAIQTTIGRFAATTKIDSPGLYIEWVLDGEDLQRGDRILEVNGSVLMVKTKEEFQKLIGTSGKCQLVVARKQLVQPTQQQQLVQSQEDNQRLQHRISYLEDQVKQLQQSTMDIINTSPNTAKRTGGHVTSINISSSPQTPSETGKPLFFQRGNFITTIVDGKPVNNLPINITSMSNNKIPDQNYIPQTSAKEIINGINHRSNYEQHQIHRHPHNHLQHSHSHQNISISRLNSTSKISLVSDHHDILKQERDENRCEQNGNDGRYSIERMDRHNSQPNLLNGGITIAKSKSNSHIYANMNRELQLRGNNPSNEHLNMRNGHSEHQKLSPTKSHRIPTELRSVQSLDFEQDYKPHSNGSESQQSQSMHRKQREVDYTSEPVAIPFVNGRIRNGTRPTPPKKPLRLSLQRAQSLQAIEANLELDRKRAIKRTHRGNKTPETPHQLIVSRSSSRDGVSQSHRQLNRLD